MTIRSMPESTEIKRLIELLDIREPYVVYNGAPPVDADPLDYLPRNLTIKGEVIA